MEQEKRTDIFLYPENAPSKGWRRMSFVAENGLCGTMLFSSKNMHGETLKLNLPVHGDYRIFLGMSANFGSTGIRIRLAGDPEFVVVNGSGNHWWGELNEICWKTAHIDDSTLEIAPLREDGISSFVYARLEKMSGPTMPAESQPGGSLMITNDGYWTYSFESLKEALMPWYGHPDCDLCFCVANGDTSEASPTTIGVNQRPTAPDEFSPNPLNHKIHETLSELRETHPNLLKELAEFAHSIGLRFHLSFRLGACDNLCGELEGHGFIKKHPELRAQRKDGVPYARWSIAYPEVRRYILAFLMEQYDLCGCADGINLILIRSMPLTGYEPAFTEAFLKKYGADPRDLADDDERVLALRYEFFSEFLLEIRTEMERRNKSSALSLIVPSAPERCRFFGVDLRKLAQGNLIEKVYISHSFQNAKHRECFEDIDIEGFGRAFQGTNCKFQFQMFGVDEPPLAPMDWFRRIRKAGASGVFIWDGHVQQQHEICRGRLLADGTGEAAEAFVKAVSGPFIPVGFDTVDGVDYRDLPPHLAY